MGDGFAHETWTPHFFDVRITSLVLTYHSTLIYPRGPLVLLKMTKPTFAS